MNKLYTLISVVVCYCCFPLAAIAELRDPTKPFVAYGVRKPEDKKKYSLKAIVISGNKKIAVLNGKILKIGDKLFDDQVTAINQQSVQLEGPSGRITLFIYGEPIKRLSATES